MKKIYYLLLISLMVIGCSKQVDTIPISKTNDSTKGTIYLLSMQIDGNVDTLSISKKYSPKILGTYSNGYVSDITDSVIITSSDTTVSLNGKNYYGAKSGKAYFTIKYTSTKDPTISYLLKDTTYVSEIENVDLSTVSFLSTPSNPNAKIIVPVVVINYYPTNNGIDIDTKRAPGYNSLSPITIDNMKLRTIDYLNYTKYGLEEGSKFRGYNNPSQLSNVSFKVVKYINVYEIKKGKMDKIGGIIYQPDYETIFNKINMKSLVENNGVKEVWFSLRPISIEYPIVKTENISPESFINVPESNMSSPTTGDISNSWRVPDDLPIYNKTYVVYGYNLETSSGNMIHNRGHQIESQLSSFGSFFWSSFGVKGRVGCTHKPPNTTLDYDWNNKTLVESDIEDWKPTGGTKKLINSDRWINIKLNNLPQLNTTTFDQNDPQYKWLLFWMQSIPGNNNGITGVNDWWDIFYNWDDAIKGGKKIIN